PNVDVGLRADDEIRVGTSVQLLTLDTPGHTFCHTCFLFNGNEHESVPALFCGDTLFHAGVGNCHNGGDPKVMYRTFAEQIFSLPHETMVYPGHDYIVNNLQFTLDREPGNAAARSLLHAMMQWPSEKHYVSNLAMEREVNSFFRLESEEIIQKLHDEGADIDQDPSEEEVFLRLRELRNKW
ncbi:MAG: hydroxyacylglutathione hydrolase C-terminal domain-containing protein, partial [Pseudomonadota bacterium]